MLIAEARHYHKMTKKTVSKMSSILVYVIWWRIADELMVKLIFHASKLVQDDYRLRSKMSSLRMCDLCSDFMVEDTEPVIMACPIVMKVIRCLQGQGEIHLHY